MSHMIHTDSDTLRLDPLTVAERLSEMSDDEVDAVVELTENAAIVNRLARIERGRRTENLRGISHTQYDLSGTEKNRRSEERKVAEWYDSGDHFDTVKTHGWKKLVAKARGPHVSNNSGENEWYTPQILTDAARKVMGSIDLDPASSQSANKSVGATEYFTAIDNGLQRDWFGNVWLNPPYAQPLIREFADKTVIEYRKDRISQACILVNNATETEWFQTLLRCANAVCFHKGRVQFWQPGQPSATPLQGQAIIYLGAQAQQFADTFRIHGQVLKP